MKYGKLQKLLRLLEQRQAIVERLLSDPEPLESPSGRPFAAVCREKIDSLEEALLELPDERGEDAELVDQWRDVVVRLWKWYFLVVGELDKKDGSKKDFEEDDDEEEDTGDGKRIYLSSSGDELTPPSSDKSSRIGRPPGQRRYSGPRRESSSSSTGEAASVDVELEKDRIRQALDAQFSSAIAVDSSSDVDSLKTLLLVVAKAAKQMPSNKVGWVDEAFHEEMFNLAKPLMPEDRMEQFLDDCTAGRRHKRLTELKVFISELIGTHYASLNRSIIEQNMRLTWWASTGEPFCRYCRSWVISSRSALISTDRCASNALKKATRPSTAPIESAFAATISATLPVIASSRCPSMADQCVLIATK